MGRKGSSPLPFSGLPVASEEFEALIKNHGVALEHWAGVPCPIGYTDRYDPRQPHHEHANCSGGIMYRRKGTVLALFLQNSLTNDIRELGNIDAGIATAVLPSEYEEGGRVTVANFDRFYMLDLEVEVVNTQKVESHLTGLDRLHYPATSIEFVIGARGEEYREGEDFVLENGAIKWISQNRPGYTPRSGHGGIYSIRYRFRPFWYVRQLIHEIRVLPGEDYLSGKRTLHRLPYQVVLQREMMFESEQRDKYGIGDARDQSAPADGSMGVR